MYGLSCEVAAYHGLRMSIPVPTMHSALVVGTPAWIEMMVMVVIRW